MGELRPRVRSADELGCLASSEHTRVLSPPEQKDTKQPECFERVRSLNYIPGFSHKHKCRDRFGSSRVHPIYGSSSGPLQLHARYAYRMGCRSRS